MQLLPRQNDAKPARRLSFSVFPKDRLTDLASSYRFYRCVQHLERRGSIAIRPNISWLDAGCHNGAFLRTIGELYHITDLHGCDQYSEALKSQWDSEWTYHQVGLEAGFDFGRQFDVISALEVIEHMTDTDRFLVDVYRSLKETGTFVLTTPNINNLRKGLSLCFR